MWYECLPPIIIISVLTVLPEVLSPYVKQLMVGTKYVRSFSNDFECNMLCRDAYQSKNWYIFNGLDSLPDKTE
ncbi:hypothetical protein ANTQUA_LOCUS1732 [Anthophora quadrimaculata]